MAKRPKDTKPITAKQAGRLADELEKRGIDGDAIQNIVFIGDNLDALARWLKGSKRRTARLDRTAQDRCLASLERSWPEGFYDLPLWERLERNLWEELVVPIHNLFPVLCSIEHIDVERSGSLSPLNLQWVLLATSNLNFPRVEFQLRVPGCRQYHEEGGCVTKSLSIPFPSQGVEFSSFYVSGNICSSCFDQLSRDRMFSSKIFKDLECDVMFAARALRRQIEEEAGRLGQELYERYSKLK